MARLGNVCSKLASAKFLRWTLSALTAALVSASVVPTASAQQAAVGDTWVTDCEGTNCVTYFMTAGLQIFIGTEVGGARELAEFRVLPTSIPGTPASIRLDTGWGGAMVVNNCNDTYCNFILDLSASPQVLEQFRAGSSGMIAYVIGEGSQIVMVPFHLTGFTAAYNKRHGG